MDAPETPLTASTRSQTPDSPLASSLYHTTATIEDITAALSNYSRVQTPEPPYLQRCCCLREECEHTKAWLAFKAKLEHRLVLSAEVGQALLKKYEAYLRRQQTTSVETTDPGRRSPSMDDSSILDMDFGMERRVATLLEENAKLEKQLNSALLNAEVVESENKTLSRDIREAKAVITRLSTIQAKTFRTDAQLNTALQDIDDLRQELDGETTRANVAESRLSTLTNKYSRVKNELRRCIEELDHRNLSRSELSEEVLKDARIRLEMLQQSQLGHSIIVQDNEILKTMELLVTDHEALKRDTAELQNLLAEAREDLRSLREENEDLKVDVSVVSVADGIRVTRPSRHRYTSSFQSNHSFSTDGIVPLSARNLSATFHRLPSPSRLTSDRGRTDVRSESRSRHSSLGPSGLHIYEPLTPDTQQTPLSPAGSLVGHEQQSHANYEVDGSSVLALTPELPEKRKALRRSLLLLKQDRSVQTDEWLGFLGVSLQPSLTGNASSIPPSDGRSESSSLIDPQSSTMATLIDRVNTLFNRLTQADALTLKNRLKRQHLPSDIGHLSRTTVNGILSEMSNLRSLFRAILEDEKVPCTCTRKDLRNALRLFKDIFTELGEMRVILNDVIMNPSIATRVSQMALEPSKQADMDKANTSGGIISMGSWIGPITKLFGAGPGHSSQQSTPSKPSDVSSSIPARSVTPARGLPRPVPRSGPALGASNAIVNVEFSSTGLGRTTAVTSITTTNALLNGGLNGESEQQTRGEGIMSLPGNSHQFLDMFAGAPHTSQEDHWVVLQNSSPQKLRQKTTVDSTKPSILKNTRRMSRNVDAVIDSSASVSMSTVNEDYEESNIETTYERGNLLERTLRPRGLSDSSIHATFLKAENENMKATSHPLPPHALLSSGSSTRQGPYPDRQSVIRSLSRKIQSFKTTNQGIQSQPQVLQGDDPDSSDIIGENLQRTASPSRAIDIIPNLASWAATKAGFDTMGANEFVRSFKDDPAFTAGHRKWTRGGLDL